MRRLLIADFKRALQSGGIYISTLIILLLLVQEGVSVGLIEMIRGEISNTTSVDLYGMTVFFSSVVLIAPMLCTLPYSAAYCEDFKSNLYYYSAVRTKKYYRYIASKVIVNAVCGGAAIFIPLTIYGVICQIFGAPFDPLNPDHLMSLQDTIWVVTLKRGGFTYIIAQSFFLGLFGSSWALASLAFSAYYPNKFAVYAFPVVICYTLHFLSARFHIGILSPIQSFDPSRAIFNHTNALLGYIYMSGYQFIISTISASVFYLVIRRRCAHG